MGAGLRCGSGNGPGEDIVGDLEDGKEADQKEEKKR